MGAVAAAGYSVRAPQWVLTYKGVNITQNISSMVLSITWTDRLGGAAGDVEVELEDRDQRWQGPWYPTQGDLMNLMIGYQGEALLPCGDFQVDELALSGAPDTFYLRGLPAYITPSLRTPVSAGYENQTLLQIAATVAGRHGLSVVGEPNQINVSFERVTQSQETDLGFLKRLANEHNYDFTVRGQQLVFYARPALEAQAPVATIARGAVMRFEFRSRTRRIYKGAQVSYLDPATKQLITQGAQAKPAMPTGDTLKLVRRLENGQQATLKAEAALHRHDMLYTTAALLLPGAPVLVAGNNVALSGWGAMDGTYIVETARHRLARATGYTTEIEARRVG